MIRIIARNDGFRRCGVAHSVNPTDWLDERFSADELEILLNEPMLMVEAVADLIDDEPGDKGLVDPKTEAAIVIDEPVVDADIADKAEEPSTIDDKATKTSKK
jgi:hypothetical protein